MKKLGNLIQAGERKMKAEMKWKHENECMNKHE